LELPIHYKQNLLKAFDDFCFDHGNKQFYGANPGERIKVILPDGSIVTLQEEVLFRIILIFKIQLEKLN
jgi:hypothetical protein